MNEVQLCNLALGRLGGHAAIESLDSADEEAQACARVYQAVAEAALCVYAWPFAERRATLAPLPTSPSSAWSGAFALPADCLKPVRIESPSDPCLCRYVPYELAGKTLLCDLASVDLVYIAFVAPDLWPPTFAQYVSWRLAGELALALDARADLAKFALDSAAAEELRAIVEARSSERPRPAPDADWLRARGGFDGGADELFLRSAR